MYTQKSILTATILALTLTSNAHADARNEPAMDSLLLSVSASLSQKLDAQAVTFGAETQEQPSGTSMPAVNGGKLLHTEQNLPVNEGYTALPRVAATGR
jgi:hypothetical protein